MAAAKVPAKSILTAPRNMFLPLATETIPPTMNKADELNIALRTIDILPEEKRIGIIGINAPKAKANKLLIAANHGDPKSCGLSPNSSLTMVSSA